MGGHAEQGRARRSAPAFHFAGMRSPLNTAAKGHCAPYAQANQDIERRGPAWK
jgi:hypothetical protein